MQFGSIWNQTVAKFSEFSDSDEFGLGNSYWTFGSMSIVSLVCNGFFGGRLRLKAIKKEVQILNFRSN